jgi:hypothetical protein
MKLDQETWARIFPWLEKAQDVPAADLAEWIARIVEEQPRIGIPLREAPGNPNAASPSLSHSHLLDRTAAPASIRQSGEPRTQSSLPPRDRLF